MANSNSVSRIPVRWTSDASGNANVAVPGLNGMIVGAQFVPGTGGAQPTNNYSASLYDASGFDLLLGKAVANLSNATITKIAPAGSTTDANTLAYGPVAEDCVLVITGAGNAKSGIVNLYLR
jgi:hypothetical protein